MNQFQYRYHRFKSDCIDISVSDEELKIVAFCLMVIDHISLYTGWTPGRIIGRISMPIFLYLLIVGNERTSSKEKYWFRLFKWGIVSQIIMIVCDVPSKGMNILLTFSLCLLFLQHKNKIQWLGVYCVIAEFLNFGYGWYGIVCCYLIDLYCRYFEDKDYVEKNCIKKCLWFVSWMLINGIYSINFAPQWFAIYSIFVVDLLKKINRYERIKVPKFTRTLWYASYPIQWMILSLVF